jgi:hypothetical protein
LNADYADFIHVNVFNDKDNRHITVIKRELSAAINRFQFEIKSFPDIDVHIYIAPDKRTYEEWIHGRAVVFENSLGFTDLVNNIIYIKNPVDLRDDRSVIRLLLHEYIHLFIHYHWSDAPLWFHEGMAVFFTENITLNRLYQFTTNNAFHTDYLLLRYAYTYPENRTNVEPFYFQSTLLMRYIVENNMDKLINLFDLAEMYPRFSDAFQIAFNTTQIEFLDSFEKEIRLFFRTYIYIGVILLTWLSFPILLIIARIRRYKKTKQVLKDWDMEEAEMQTEVDVNTFQYNLIITNPDKEEINEEK